MLAIDLKTITLVNYFDQPRKNLQNTPKIICCHFCIRRASWKLEGRRNAVITEPFYCCNFDIHDTGEYEAHKQQIFKVIDDLKNAGYEVIKTQLNP